MYLNVKRSILPKNVKLLIKLPLPYIQQLERSEKKNLLNFSFITSTYYLSVFPAIIPIDFMLGGIDTTVVTMNNVHHNRLNTNDGFLYIMNK